MAGAVTAGREAERDLELDCEVLVIGSGAGGAPAAAALAAAGHDVILVEAGGAHGAGDVDQRELPSLERLYAEDGRRATADLGIQVMTGRSLGGSTAHNTGYIYRAPAALLERWRREAGFDIDEPTMAGYYAEAAQAIGVRQLTRADSTPHNEVFWRGAARLGWRARRTTDNRTACSGCGYCILGCAYNKKQGTSLTFVPRLLAAGGRVICDAPVRQLRRQGDGWRAEGWLRNADRSPSGRSLAVRASRVVVSAGGVDGPALLQRSGLGGRQVGRGLRLHPAAAVGGLFDEPLVSWRGLPQAVMVEEFADFFTDGHGGFLLMPANATPALMAPLVPGIGPQHAERMLRMPQLAFGAVLVHDETRGRVRERRGPRLSPRIDYWPDRRDRELMLRGIGKLAELYFAAGASEVVLPIEGLPAITELGQLPTRLEAARPRMKPGLLGLQSVHPQGTCAIGADPARSVVRPDLRLHDAEGVYVADTSVFPTSLGVPPQLTAMALGLHAAAVIGAG